MSQQPLPVPATLDIEASGFGARSYPIEIGYVDEQGSTYCSLIRPADGWIHWDASAAAMHGISRETLMRHGREPVQIARELNERLAGKVLYSDAWANDLSWLHRLFDEADLVPRFRLESLRALLNEDQAARWHEAKSAAARELDAGRHRASSDAQVLQRALISVRRAPVR
jgi:hypothetical protein